MLAARRDSTRTRRRQILDAALALFVERGVGQTTMEDIRERSGASVGSLYHHFGQGKDEMAATLYLETIREYQTGFLAELRRHRLPAAGIRATVRYHLGWVQDHGDAARFLFNYGDLEIPSRTQHELAELNQRLFAEVRSWAAEVSASQVLDLPFDLATALWLGPAQQFARRWLAGAATTSIEQTSPTLADAAWAALSAATHPEST